MSDHHTHEWESWCAMCEYEEAVDLLRQVANSDCFDVAHEVIGFSGHPYMTCFLKRELWDQILSFRNVNTNKKEG